MNREDSTRLRGIVDGLAGRTRYEGQPERTDEFLVRVLREAFAQQLTRAGFSLGLKSYKYAENWVERLTPTPPPSRRSSTGSNTGTW
jgi:hypothetical protein